VLFQKKAGFLGLLLCFLMTFSISLLQGQNQNHGVLSGKLIDGITLKPVPDANVLIQDLNKGTSSDVEGNFYISDLPAGNYKLIITHVSYQNIEKRIQIKRTQKTHISLSMYDTVLLLEAAEIVARKEGSVLDQSNRIHIIGLKEIRFAPVSGLNQIMDYSSGIISNNTTGIYSSRVVVSMRGMPANDQGRTLVLADGVPLNKADGGSVNWNMLQKSNIEEINIIKGPGPAKYGSSAMGGVIEIISKIPEDTISGNINLEYGTYNTYVADMGISGLFKTKKTGRNLYWNLSAVARQSAGYNTMPEEFREIGDSFLIPSHFEDFTLSLRAGYKSSNNHRIEVQTLFFDDFRSSGIKVFDNNGAYSRHNTLMNQIKYIGLRGFLKWKINLFNNSENYFRIYEYMQEGEYTLYEADALRRDNGLYVDFEYFKFYKHSISFGMNAKSGSVQGKDTYYTSSDIISNSGKMDIAALYIQDEISLIENRLFINAGMRFDYARFYKAAFSIDYPSYSIDFYKDYEIHDQPDKYWNTLSPRLSLRYHLKDNTRFFVSLAKGFRAPMLDDMCRTGNRKRTFAVANPDLKPENVWAFELGNDILIKKKLLFSVSCFHSIGYDFMYYVSTGDSVNMGYRLAPIISKSNIGKVAISGFEWEIKYEISEKVSAFVNHTFTHAKITDHEVNNPLLDSNLTNKFLTDIPDHKISGGLRISLKILDISLLYKYYGATWINEWNTVENEYFFSDKFEDYHTFNILFEKSFGKHFYASLRIENVFAARFTDAKLQECPGRMCFLKAGFFL
jgi:iron complex outermembrane recepter protein